MAYIVRSKDGVRQLATGKQWRFGQQIGDHQLPPRLIEALLDEGVIEAVKPTTPPAEIEPLMGIDGMTWALAGKLHDMGLHTVADVAQTSDEVLTTIPRVGKTLAAKLISSAEALVKAASTPAPRDKETAPSAEDPRRRIDGVTAEMLQPLTDLGLLTVAEVAGADPALLMAIPGVGSKTAAALIEAAQTVLDEE